MKLETTIFPPITDDYMGKTHIARLLSLIVDRMNIDFILKNIKTAADITAAVQTWRLGRYTPKDSP